MKLRLRYLNFLFCFLFLSILAACASTHSLQQNTQTQAESNSSESQTQQIKDNSDPLEPLNRKIFSFNETIDKAILIPVAKAYKNVFPDYVRYMIGNFFSNLADVPILANYLLQAELTQATETLMRISINTVFGIGGLFDFATPAQLKKQHNDVGVTLGKWGMTSGPYIMLPFFGPSTVRDTSGRVLGIPMNPIFYVKPWSATYELEGISIVHRRSELLDASDFLEQSGLDKYTFLRDAYLQSRRQLISGQSAQSEQALPQYETF